SRRTIATVAVFCCAAAPLLRYFLDIPFPYVLPVVHLDSVGLGMLLALGFAFQSRVPVSTVIVGIVLFAAILANRHLSYSESGQYAVAGSLLAWWSAWAVLSAANSRGGFLGRVLEAKPLVWLGSISYSVFVVHLPMPYLTEALAQWTGLSGM